MASGWRAEGQGRRGWGRFTVAAAGVVVAAGAGACGGPPAPASPDAPTPSAAAPAASSATADGPQRIPGRQRVQSPELLKRRARQAVAPDTLGVVKSRSGAPRSNADVYRDVAPATVIVRVPKGLGSGVIVDPAGWVLTNHHVIKNGTMKDFEVSARVVLGKLNKSTGGMDRGKEYEATVYDYDELRDLALLKIKDPPRGLPHVELAPKNPVPGEEVMALGHAGAGMLWALKPGEISALGKLSEQLAVFARFDETTSGKAEAAKFRKFLDGQHLGLVIQSSCNVLPGDSGGPLVTRQGRLVGLNAFARKDPRTGGLLSFHIHRTELAKFLAKRPKVPRRFLPDPWKDGGGDGVYEDANLDGRVDTLILKGRRACAFCPMRSVAVFVDGNQDSFRGRTVPPLGEVYEKRDFDAELVFLQIGSRAYVWYDTDDDGRYDRLLSVNPKTGQAVAAHALDKDGKARPTEMPSGPGVRSSLFEGRLAPRIARIIATAFPSRLTGVKARAHGMPDPVTSFGTGELTDLDRNGVQDAVRVRGAYSNRLMVDVSESALGKLPAKVDLAKFGTTTETEKGSKSASSLDLEFSAVAQGPYLWTWYDTDDDGRFDLVLHAPGSRLYVATQAFRVGADGAFQPAPAFEGRKLVRAGAFENAALKERFQRMIGKGFLSILSAKGGDGLQSFPEPVKDHRGAGFQLVDVPGLRRVVVAATGQGSDGYLVDLDRSSRGLGPAATKGKGDVKGPVMAGKFDAEFAYFQRGGLAWTFYDTDNKDGYDVVLYAGSVKAGTATRGYRVTKDGEVSLDAALAGKALVSPSLFSPALRYRMKRVAGGVFGEQLVEK